MWAKIITIKRSKDLNYFNLCALNLFNTQVHNLSWITEINEIFHDILIYWDAPVYTITEALWPLTKSIFEPSNIISCYIKVAKIYIFI